ncbi:MAG: LysE family translocator [Sediminibacterium sp.]|jgi:threonine/homoserine/homoserine lactone efflux protein|nr:LysE family translocator [Chitinophagaceae bacterium]
MYPALIKGIALGLLLSISVGPVIFAIIKQSINNGHKAGYVFVAGVSASDITLVLVCNLFTALFETALNHRTSIAIIGSCFLVAVGIYTLFFKKLTTDEENNVVDKKMRKRDFLGIFISGYLMNILNPAVFIFWLAWTTAILGDAAAAASPLQYKITVFATCLVVVLITDIAKVVLAGKLRAKLTPYTLRLINKISGLVLIGFGIALCWGAIAFKDL